MPAYIDKATGVHVDIPAELAERIGGFEPLTVASVGGATDPKPVPRRTRRTSDDD